MSEPTALGGVAGYAGFWRRVAAYLIDYFILGMAAFALFALTALFVPALPQIITPDLPFDVLTVEKTIEEKSTETASGDTTTTEIDSLVEKTVFGTWTYLYRVHETKTSTKGSTVTMSTQTTQQIDPVTKLDLQTTDLNTIVFVAAFFYFALMESSRRQATLGKMALGIEVSDTRGQRLNFSRALIRNLAKLLSMLSLLIGFMMAGWTERKQALHDFIADAVVKIR